MLTDAYAQLVAKLRHHVDLAAGLRLLEWDQETFMPSGVVEARARQIGSLAALVHEQETAPAFIELVDQLATRIPELSPEQAVDVRETKWRIDRVRALDTELVRQRSELHAQARAVWITARDTDDFTTLAPYLQRIILVERQVASAIDPHRDAYDVLLEEYEPGTSTVTLSAIFDELRTGLLPLVERLRARLEKTPIVETALCGQFSVDLQRQLNRAVAERLGFNFTRGRLDEAVHPFTTSIGEDVRLTTRYDAGDLRYALYSTIHETGHGLYEQGLDPSAWGTPRGTSCSLGIHESQSRLWENQVGRSESFWRVLLPVARAFFPSLEGATMTGVLAAVNAARPSLIRTESDEITYNLHIILRFELERSLIDGSLDVDDLPDAWNHKMRIYLGVVPDRPRDGVLQDVHWASGAIGYFPTYALGNIYAAQLMRAARAELGPEVLDQADGLAELLGWLRAHVHQWGQTYRASQLVTEACGEPPQCRPLLEHLGQRLAFLEAL